MESMPVVVGVDGSQESLRAAEWAAREAQRHQAPLRVVSVPATPPRVHAHDTVPPAVTRAVVVAREETTAALLEVAVGIRDPHDTTDTLGFAFEEAALRHATLVAVHSCWLPATLGVLAADGDCRSAHPEQALAEARSALSNALDGWREKYPAVPVRLDVVNDHPAKVLASYSARTDLIVSGGTARPAAAPPSGRSSTRCSATRTAPSRSSRPGAR